MLKTNLLVDISYRSLQQQFAIFFNPAATSVYTEAHWKHPRFICEAGRMDREMLRRRRRRGMGERGGGTQQLARFSLSLSPVGVSESPPFDESQIVH